MKTPRFLMMIAVLFNFGASTAFAQGVKVLTNRDSTNAPSTQGQFDTPAKRRAIQPLPWLTQDETENSGRSQRNGGAPVLAEPTKPNPAAQAEARKSFADQWDLIEADNGDSGNAPDQSAANFGTHDIYTQYCENCAAPVATFPQIAIGKLFVTTPTGSTGTCSASVISANNIIVTAAHCCYAASGGWNTSFEFFPAYRNGAAPYGSFDWQRAVILSSYMTNPRRDNDMCVIELRNNTSGQPVTFYTGSLGRSQNFGYTQNMHALGYPGNIGGGQYLELCTAESRRPPKGCTRKNVVNMGCSMTYGASGGPWIRSYRNGNYVNSVVSGYDNSSCTGGFGTTFNGPRFHKFNIGRLCDRIGC